MNETITRITFKGSQLYVHQSDGVVTSVHMPGHYTDVTEHFTEDDMITIKAQADTLKLRGKQNRDWCFAQ